MNFSLGRRQRSRRSCVRADEAAAALVGPGDTVLVVWHRPGDEALLAGGLLDAATRIGARVVHVHAVGETSGAHAVTLFPHLEERAADVPRADGIRAVRRVIETYEPDVVLTFDADGITGDPDRRSVARWVARALAASGLAERIAHVVVDVAARWPEDLVRRLHLADTFWPGFPVRRSSGVGCDVHLGDDAVAAKLVDAAAHPSTGRMRTALGPDGLHRLAALEGYRAANDAARSRMADLHRDTAVAA